MNFRLRRALLLSLVALGCPVQSAPPATLESLQQQVEELKVVQGQLVEEIQELKRLVQESNPIHPVAAIPEAPAVISQNIRGEPFRGSSEARVAILEYSDFNCSFCNRFATNVYPHLERDFIRTGKVKYLFRDLPDKLDPDSLIKAQAARCAGEQDRFWEAHDHFFTDPTPLLKNPGATEQFARALHLDVGKVQQCLQSGRYAGPIARVAADAKRFGLHGTPSFLIGRLSENGEVIWATKIVHGADSYGDFRANLTEFFPAVPAPAPASK